MPPDRDSCKYELKYHWLIFVVLVLRHAGKPILGNWEIPRYLIKSRIPEVHIRIIYKVKKSQGEIKNVQIIYCHML